jgi:hypothetical protein
MLRSSTSLLIGLAVAMIGCKEPVARAAPVVTNIKAPREIHEVGEIGSDGRLVIWVSKRGSYDVPFPLYHDYGVMLINEGGEKHPKALYVVGCQAKKKVWRTHDFKEFQRLVNAIPKGATVQEYDSCTVNLFYGLPEKVGTEFDKALKRFKLKDEERHIVCICGSVG